MLAKKPYITAPFNVFVKIGAPWATELKERVTNVVAAYQKAIVEEAEFEGNPRMADEDFLYSRFKDNVAGGLVYANWEVLKYFYMSMRMKMYKEIIGDWTFTEHDVEMYNYFVSMDVKDSEKCVAKYLKWKSQASVNEYELLDRYFYSREYYSAKGECCKGVYYAYDPSWQRYNKWIALGTMKDRKAQLLEEMVLHCKKCKSAMYERDNYFTTKKHWDYFDTRKNDINFSFDMLQDVCYDLSKRRMYKDGAVGLEDYLGDKFVINK